jgi:short-chain Z-isoprenyl diphosphate synthase
MPWRRSGRGLKSAIAIPTGPGARLSKKPPQLQGQHRPVFSLPGADATTATMKRVLYSLYERRLHSQIHARPTPRHVGIILDGNRRYARKRGLADPRAAYDLGAKKLDDVLAWCSELQIPAVTLWVCSIDNLKRPEAEVCSILEAVETKIRALAQDPTIHRLRVRVRAVGRLDLLPPSTAAVLRESEDITADYDGIKLTIAIAYGGREEIADAIRGLIREKIRQGATLATIAGEITPEAVDGHLYTAGLPEPDLIIRTSGEVRLSGFLLWQSVHSEFYFSDVNWPDFRKVDFLRAIRSFQQRARRFGR